MIGRKREKEGKRGKEGKRRGKGEKKEKGGIFDYPCV
jgi:hypothetical protein